MPPKPRLRSAKLITLSELRQAAASGTPTRFQYALIDGCRAGIDPKQVYPIALKALRHRSYRVRYGALFALEFLAAHTALHVSDPDQPIHLVSQLAGNTREHEDVRYYAVQLLTRLIFELNASR